MVSFTFDYVLSGFRAVIFIMDYLSWTSICKTVTAKKILNRVPSDCKVCRTCACTAQIRFGNVSVELRTSEV